MRRSGGGVFVFTTVARGGQGGGGGGGGGGLRALKWNVRAGSPDQKRVSRCTSDRCYERKG